jgi:hypothetical protein
MQKAATDISEQSSDWVLQSVFMDWLHLLLTLESSHFDDVLHVDQVHQRLRVKRWNSVSKRICIKFNNKAWLCLDCIWSRNHTGSRSRVTHSTRGWLMKICRQFFFGLRSCSDSERFLCTATSKVVWQGSKLDAAHGHLLIHIPYSTHYFYFTLLYFTLILTFYCTHIACELGSFAPPRARCTANSTWSCCRHPNLSLGSCLLCLVVNMFINTGL